MRHHAAVRASCARHGLLHRRIDERLHSRSQPHLGEITDNVLTAERRDCGAFVPIESTYESISRSGLPRRSRLRWRPLSDEFRGIAINSSLLACVCFVLVVDEFTFGVLENSMTKVISHRITIAHVDRTHMIPRPHGFLIRRTDLDEFLFGFLRSHISELEELVLSVGERLV